ncbi:MAG: substrate-binding domain-containing protein [Sulfuritalea sp.]|nr:substrate-binding domain-containing protein [Sulfuritalea sp.]
MQTLTLRGISSMATRQVLAELAGAWRQQGDADVATEVAFESVGGVDAARRVQAGEPFDVVVLDTAALDKLVAAGCVVADSKVDVVRSPVAIAVRAGAPQPDVGSAATLRQAALSATTLGYSTGPSGTALLQLFERWGILETVRDRLVQAPSGVPVARLVADGEVALGFQQFSEMMNVSGIEVLGTMPADCAIVSTFSAGLCTTSTRPDAVRALLAFMCSPVVADIKRRHGMEAA